MSTLQDIVVAFRGPLLAGYCLDLLLYGILTVQTYLYFVAFPNDRYVTKAIVVFVYSVGTTQTILAIHDFYLIFCIPDNYDSVLSSGRFGFMWLTVPLSSALVATVAQLFYANRIYVLSRKKIVTGMVIILALAQLSFGIVSTLDFHDDIPEESPLSGSMNAVGWGAAGMTCDLVIAVYMSWFLTMQLRRTSRTTQVLTRIKRLLLETGLLTAIVATAYPLLTGLVGMNTFTIPGLSLGKLYSNSVLVLLNNRFTIAGGRNEPTFEFGNDSYPLSEFHRRENPEHGIRESAQME